MLVEGCLDYWISLVMLFHQHLKRTEGDSKHISELHGIDGMFLCMEHAWLGLFNGSKFVNFCLITTHSMVLDISFHQFILYISLRVLLPIVVNLFIDKSVCLFKDLTDVCIGSELNIHLHSYEFLHDTNLGVQCINLSSVRVFKIIRSQIHSGSFSHEIDHDLNQALLFKSVASVLIGLHILHAKLKFGSLVFLLPLKHLSNDGKSVNIG